MTIEQCYRAMDADYEGVIRRFGNEARVRRFLSKLPDDPNFDLLNQSLEQGDFETAFRAVHSLKGVCLNLGLSALAVSSSALSEALRGGTPTPDWPQLHEQVAADYSRAVEAITALAPA